MSVMSQSHSVMSQCHGVIFDLGEATASKEPGEKAGGCHAAEERTTGVHEVAFQCSIINQREFYLISSTRINYL